MKTLLRRLQRLEAKRQPDVIAPRIIIVKPAVPDEDIIAANGRRRRVVRMPGENIEALAERAAESEEGICIVTLEAAP